MLADKEQKRKARIEKQLTIPLPKFILVHGALFGILLILGLMPGRIIFGKYEWVKDNILFWLPIGIVIGIIGGFTKRSLLREELNSLNYKEASTAPDNR
jgi:hypothetical protein